jgi:hypothetical protein
VTCLAAVAGPFDSLAPATALPALTKTPCRWDCERQRQDGGIHRPAAGNVLHSLVSSLPTGPPFLRSGLNNCNLIFGGQPLKLFARCPIGCARRSDWCRPRPRCDKGACRSFVLPRPACGCEVTPVRLPLDLAPMGGQGAIGTDREQNQGASGLAPNGASSLRASRPTICGEVTAMTISRVGRETWAEIAGRWPRRIR